MPDPERIYWDSMVFNHRIAGTHPDMPILKHISDRAERGEIELLTSIFTLCEVAKVEPTGQALTVEEQESRIDRFFQNPYILPIQVDRRVAQLTRSIIRQFSIKGKDAVHIASAIIAKAAVMQTYDKDLLKLNMKIGSPLLRIETPTWKDGQVPLLEEEEPAP
jgi:predicted nucleic acid-binding protein